MAREDIPDDPLEERLHEIEVVIHEGNFGLAQDMLEESRKEFEKLRGNAIHARFLLKMAHIFVFRRRDAEATEYLHAAAEIIESSDPKKPVWARCAQEKLWLQSRQTLFTGNRMLAKTLLEMALNERKDIDELTGKVYGDLAILVSEGGKVEEALHHFDKAISILEEEDYPWELARVHNNTADSYMKLEWYDRALQHAEMAVEVANGCGNKRVAGFAHCNAAEALARSGELDKALDHLKDAKEVVEDPKDPYYKAYFQYLVGLVRSMEGNFSDAEVAFSNAMDLLENSENVFFFGTLLHEHAIMLVRMNRVEEAKEQLLYAKEVFTKLNSILDVKKVDDDLARIG